MDFRYVRKSYYKFNKKKMEFKMIQDYATNFPKTQKFLVETAEERKLWTKKIELQMVLAMTTLHLSFVKNKFDKYLIKGMIINNEIIDVFAHNYAKNFQMKVESVWAICGTYENEIMDNIIKKFTPESFVELSIKKYGK